MEELLSQTAEGGQQQTHALICRETSLTEKHTERSTNDRESDGNPVQNASARPLINPNNEVFVKTNTPFKGKATE